MRLGQRLSYETLKADYAVFSPFIDFTLFFQGPIGMEEIKGCSMAWLEVAQAVIVQPHGAKDSPGTRAELARAQELGIPVFWKLEDLNCWRSEGARRGNLLDKYLRETDTELAA